MFTADDQSVRIFDVNRYKQSGKTTQQQAYLANIAYRFAGKHCWHVQVRSQNKVDFVKLLELMEKNDQKKLQLLYYLDQHPNRKLKNSELQDKLQISYYLLNARPKRLLKILQHST